MFFRRRIVNKDQLVDLAYNFIEENGYESLNEVNLAKKTHISKKKIREIASLEEIKRLVFHKANEFYNRSLEEALKMSIPMKNVTLNSIIFASKHKNLFLFLIHMFATHTQEEYNFMNITNNTFENTVKELYGLSEDASKNYVTVMSVYTFGLCLLSANSNGSLNMSSYASKLFDLSYAMCKTYYEHPELMNPKFDKEILFRDLVKSIAIDKAKKDEC